MKLIKISFIRLFGNSRRFEPLAPLLGMHGILLSKAFMVAD
jgi:hypothetical protein